MLQSTEILLIPRVRKKPSLGNHTLSYYLTGPPKFAETTPKHGLKYTQTSAENSQAISGIWSKQQQQQVLNSNLERTIQVADILQRNAKCSLCLSYTAASEVVNHINRFLNVTLLNTSKCCNLKVNMHLTVLTNLCKVFNKELEIWADDATVCTNLAFDSCF